MDAVKTLNTMHPHMQKVRDFCEMQGDVPKVALPGGVGIYPFSQHMTVFSHGGKAYAVSGISNPFKQLWDGQIRDISKAKPAGIEGLGVDYNESNDTLQHGKPLTPEECKALWADLGFKPVDVLHLLDKHLPNSGTHAKKAIEGAGLEFATKQEAKKAFIAAGTFRDTSLDRVVDEMYE